MNSTTIDQIQIDSRRIDSKNALFVALKGALYDGHDFVAHAAKQGAKFALVKKGYVLSQPVKGFQLLQVDDPLKSFQEIAQAYREEKRCQIIAVTGSYGKTMVKDLLFEMIREKKRVVCSPESFNSQIGVPLSLLKIKKEDEIAIIEAACSQKNEMDNLKNLIQPCFGILTPVGKKHAVTLGNLNETYEEMIKLLACPSLKEWVLLPQTPEIKPHLSRISASHYFWNQPHPLLPHAYSQTDDSTFQAPYKVQFPDVKPFQGQITSGFYYFIDLLNMCIKAAYLLGASYDEITSVIKNYTPEPMRTEVWRSPLGTTFINDTYCSDPQSIDQSLKFLDSVQNQSRKVFLFGGFKKHTSLNTSEFKRVASSLARHQIDHLILYGERSYNPLIEEVVLVSPKTSVHLAKNYADALEAYRKEQKAEDIVLIKGDKKQPFDLLSSYFNDSICTNQCVINLAAIKSNLASIQSKLPPKTRLMVLVKALAYGTDDLRMAKFLASFGVDILGVSYVDEGVALKRAGVTQSIFVINAATYEVSKVVKWGLEVGASSRSFIETLQTEAFLQNKIIKVHLHVDTGMSRFGCRPEEATFLAELIQRSSHLTLEGIMTHFACAEDPEQDEFTLKQAKQLEEIIEAVERKGITIPWRHAANSSAAIRFQFPHFNMVRIGLAVFGLYSSPAVQKELEMRLAVSLVSRIVGINHCKEGDTISYGRSYVVKKEYQKIAVLPIGYFDGLHRNYSGKGYVMVRGKKAPMVGTICMDFMMIDVTDIPHASVGDPVLIFGEDECGHYLSPEELAERGSSIVYELITCLGPRIQRVFVYEEAYHSQTIR